MSDPSGEKDGSVSTPGVAVSRRAEPPLRPTTHRSPAYSKATRSLLTAGWRSRRVPWAWSAVAQPNAAAARVRCLGIIRLPVESVILSEARDRVSIAGGRARAGTVDPSARTPIVIAGGRARVYGRARRDRGAHRGRRG